MVHEVEGVAFLDALRARYKEGSVGVEGCRELAGRAGLSARDMVKQTHLELLERVVLQDADVTNGGAPGAIAAACPKIEELDLTGNPIGGWDAALAIARELPALRFFSLVRVALPPPPPATISSVGATFGALRTLVLNETGLAWKDACEICAQVPALEELQLSDHPIHLEAEQALSAERDLGAIFPALRTLLLENASVGSWEDVWRLRALPKLEVLSLNTNPIDHVRYDHAPAAADGAAEATEADAAAAAAPTAAAPFATLQRLFLLESQLGSWEDVDQCNRFPALRELRCAPRRRAPPRSTAAARARRAPRLPTVRLTRARRRALAARSLARRRGERRLQDAPVVKGIGASVARQMIIARVGSIDALNGATVSRREREAAERFYLRQSIQHYPEPLPTAAQPAVAAAGEGAVRARARGPGRSRACAVRPTLTPVPPARARGLPMRIGIGPPPAPAGAGGRCSPPGPSPARRARAGVGAVPARQPALARARRRARPARRAAAASAGRRPHARHVSRDPHSDEQGGRVSRRKAHGAEAALVADGGQAEAGVLRGVQARPRQAAPLLQRARRRRRRHRRLGILHGGAGGRPAAARLLRRLRWRQGGDGRVGARGRALSERASGAHGARVSRGGA